MGERERQSEGDRRGDLTSWYPSRTKAVLIKFRHKTFTWIVRACLPDMDQVRRGLKEKRE
jgi:hypothetical protein